jgi:hypothetical protein
MENSRWPGQVVSRQLWDLSITHAATTGSLPPALITAAAASNYRACMTPESPGLQNVSLYLPGIPGYPGLVTELSHIYGRLHGSGPTLSSLPLIIRCQAPIAHA